MTGITARQGYRVNAALEEVDKAMVTLRQSMSGIQIRTAGFKRCHDELARKVATLSVHFADSAALLPQN